MTHSTFGSDAGESHDVLTRAVWRVRLSRRSPLATPVLRPADVDVSVAAYTEAPPEQWLVVVVTVVNNRTQPVWVQLRGAASSDYWKETFGFELSGNGGHVAQHEDRMPLAAHEVKRFAFDQPMSDARAIFLLLPGDYVLKGTLKRDTLAREPFRVKP
jgi:hypothetical protein